MILQLALCLLITCLQHFTEARNFPVDILFILDESGSVSTREFQQQLDVAIGVINNLDIGPDKDQVGLITYGESVREHFPLNGYSNSADLVTAVGAIGAAGGGTATDVALQYAVDNSFFRRKLPGHRSTAYNFVVLLTDGKSSLSRTLYEAGRLKEIATVIAIGYGTGISETEIEGIASAPENALIETSGLQDLTRITGTIANRLSDPLAPFWNPSVDSTVEPSTTSVGIVVGVLLLISSVASVTAILVRRQRRLRQKLSLMRNADASPLSHMTWDYLLVYDSRIPITMFTEELVSALRSLQPRPAVRRTTVHRLYIEEEQVKARHVACFICEENTSLDTVKTLCSNLQVLSAHTTVFINVLDSSGSSGRAYRVEYGALGKPQNPVMIRELHTKADIFQLFLEQNFNCKSHFSRFSLINHSSMLNVSQGLLNQLTAHLAPFRAPEYLPFTTANVDILIVDTPKDALTQLQNKKQNGGKNYVFVTRISRNTGDKLHPKWVVFGSNEVLKGVLTVLFDQNIVSSKETLIDYICINI